jgi:hypothetical protein
MSWAESEDKGSRPQRFVYLYPEGDWRLDLRFWIFFGIVLCHANPDDPSLSLQFYRSAMPAAEAPHIVAGFSVFSSMD